MSDKNPAQFDNPDDDFEDQIGDEFDDESDDAFEDEFDTALEDADFDDDFDDNDDNDDNDDADDDDDGFGEDGLGKELSAFFKGDDYEIVDMAWLVQSALEAPDLAALDLRAAIGLAELIRRLREQEEMPSLVELAALANVPAAERDLLRTLWPTTPVAKRRAALDALLEAVALDLPLDLGELLRLALDDADAAVRYLGVTGLADEARPDCLGRLAQLLRHDDDVAVRAAAASALGSYVLAGELDELEPALAMRAEEALMAALADPNEGVEVQRCALESIAYSGEVGVRQLIEDAYYSPDEELRLSALTAMGRSADVRWRNLARAELSNPTPAMRAAAAYAVGELEASAALPEILSLVDDEDKLVRLAAIFALGHLGGREARTVLQRMSHSTDETEAMAAEEALDELAFYAGAEAQVAPLFVEEDEDDDDEDWRFASNANLGNYN